MSFRGLFFIYVGKMKFRKKKKIIFAPRLLGRSEYILTFQECCAGVCRNVGTYTDMGAGPHQFLADTLTLFQSEYAD